MHFSPREQERYRLRIDDVLVTEASGSRNQVGQTALVTEAVAGLMFQNTLLRLRPAGDTDGRYLYWWSRHAFVSGLYSEASQGLGIWHLGAERMGAIPVPVMSILEQRQIADFLDDQVALLDRAIDLRQQQAELADEAFKSRWSARVRGAGPAVPLRRVLFSICDGPFGSSLTSAHYSDEGARVIRLGNLGAGEWRDADAAYISSDYYEDLKQHAVRPGDLLIAGLGDESNPLGRACLAPDDLGLAIVKADCYRVRLDQKRCLHGWAAMAISSTPVTDATRTLSRGSTRARINTDIARNIALPMPAMAVQRTLLSEHSLDREAVRLGKTAILRGKYLLQERKQALITAAVTGQFDVSTASSRSVA